MLSARGEGREVKKPYRAHVTASLEENTMQSDGRFRASGEPAMVGANLGSNQRLDQRLDLKWLED